MALGAYIGNSTYNKRNYLAGFASDTTAIIFSRDLESTSGTSCGIQSCGGSTDMLDVELKLVDVRFHKIYWKSKVKNNYGVRFQVKQWSDSTIIIGRQDGGGGIIDGYLLWKIGSAKPQELILNWNTEKEVGLVSGSRYKWLRWENFPKTFIHD